MRILILQDDFPPQSSAGAERSVFEFTKGLKAAGHDVFVITTCQDKSLEGKIDYEGLKIFKIFTNYHQRWRAYLSLYNPAAVKKVEELIRKINPDIVHAHNLHYYLSYHCLKSAKKLGKPVFWTARDVMAFNYEKLATKKYLNNLDCKTNFFDHIKQASKRYNPFRNILIKKYLGYADKIFAVSDSLKIALNQNGICNVQVSHTGINVKDWQAAKKSVENFKKKHKLSGKKIVFFGGRISDLKGFRQISQAMEIVKKEIPKATLLTAGSEGLGWLHGEELKSCYYASDLVVVPSVCLDCFPRTNLEAMACKKPVIATSYGGSSEIVKDGATGFIVNPFNIGLLAEKIICLLKNPKKAKRFGLAGFKRVKENFNLSSQVNQLINWYKKQHENSL